MRLYFKSKFSVLFIIYLVKLLLNSTLFKKKKLCCLKKLARRLFSHTATQWLEAKAFKNMQEKYKAGYDC